MAAGERLPRRAAEVRMDEIPVVFNTPLFDVGGVLMAVAPTPWMEDDKQRAIGIFGGEAAGGLLCLVVGSGIEEIFCEEFWHGCIDDKCGIERKTTEIKFNRQEEDVKRFAL